MKNSTGKGKMSAAAYSLERFWRYSGTSLFYLAEMDSNYQQLIKNLCTTRGLHIPNH
jgi:hypothetical protein